MNELKEDDYRKLVKRAYGWDLSKLNSEISSYISDFSEECLVGNNCYQGPASGAIVGIRNLSGSLCQAYGFENYNRENLSRAISQYYIYSYLHYRFLRCLFKNNKNVDLYAIGLCHLGFGLCSAIFMQVDKEATWMSIEYIRHVDDNYQCPYSSDTEFISVCYWLAKSFLEGGFVSDSELTHSLGRYNPLAKAAKSHDLYNKYFSSVLNERTSSAISKTLYNNEEINVYYTDFFLLYFPLN